MGWCVYDMAWSSAGRRGASTIDTASASRTGVEWIASMHEMAVVGIRQGQHPQLWHALDRWSVLGFGESRTGSMPSSSSGASAAGKRRLASLAMSLRRLLGSVPRFSTTDC